MKNKKNKNKTLLKLLLWILFFPIMATVALCRSERITVSAKIFSVAAIWVIFFSILEAYGNTLPDVEEPKATTPIIEITTPSETTDNTDDTVVYVTPTGKKYHLLMSCAGVNAVEKTLSEVTGSYSPCKTCASHQSTTEQITPPKITTEPEITTTPEITTKPEVTTTTEITTTPEVTTSSEVTTEENERIVYKTPTGKRYHYSLDCAGKNGTPITISEAKELGLTLCNNCKNK